MNFKVTNFLSFKDRTSLSMVASDLPVYDDRLSKIDGFKLELLPISAVFGGNATGKSNLVEALKFVREFVTEGTRKSDSPISVTPFLLNQKCKETDSGFEIDMLIGNTIHVYSFSVNKSQVCREKLVSDYGAGEQLVFKRIGKKFELGNVFKKLKKSEIEYYKIISNSTRKNQLFLTNLSLQEKNILEPVFNWFENLVIVGSFNSYNTIPFIAKDYPYTQMLNKAIQKLDVGVSNVTTENIPIENAIPDQMKKKLSEDVNDNSFVMLESRDGDKIRVTSKKGELFAEVLLATHLTEEGESTNFRFQLESDGTKRVMDLLPIFVDLANQDRVVVIDEIERSLHPNLVRELIESYLGNRRRKKLNSQLLFTTHNVDLMSKKLFRPDELWLIDKGENGASIVSSLSDFVDVQNEEDFQKSYLEGRFGGVPHILHGGVLQEPESAENPK